MARHEIRKAKTHDVHNLARSLREIDARECVSLFMQPPRQAILESYQESERCYSVFYDGKLASIYGVIRPTLVNNHGIIWMMSSKMIDDHPFPAAKLFVKELERVCEGFDYVYNYISPDNTKMIALLSRLGFKFEPPQKLGPLGREFIMFHRGSECA